MAITDGLITLEDARYSITNSRAATSYDSDLEAYVEAATPVIEGIVGPVLPREATYTRPVTEAGAIVLPHPFRSLVSVTIDDVAVFDYDTTPGNGIITGVSGVEAVVVANVGLTTVPSNVQLAARELVRSWWQQGRQGSRPQFPQGDSPVDVVFDESAVPKRVWQLLRPTRPVDGFA